MTTTSSRAAVGARFAPAAMLHARTRSFEAVGRMMPACAAAACTLWHEVAARWRDDGFVFHEDLLAAEPA